MCPLFLSLYPKSLCSYISAVLMHGKFKSTFVSFFAHDSLIGAENVLKASPGKFSRAYLDVSAVLVVYRRFVAGGRVYPHAIMFIS